MSEQPNKFKILVIDDEKKICDLLRSLLEIKYHVETAETTQGALSLVAQNQYDLVVTDLKLPDGSGIEILEAVKNKDVHTEVIIITAFASLDTATIAVNLGVSSYLFKPISMNNFNAQIEKAIANRSFYLKSVKLMEHYKNLNKPAKEHLSNITHIYELSRKLMYSLKIDDIMNIILQDICSQSGALISLVGNTIFGSAEVFITGNGIKLEKQNINSILINHWKNLFGYIDTQNFVPKKTMVRVMGSVGNQTIDSDAIYEIVVPLLVLGETKGCFAIFLKNGSSISDEKLQYLHVFSSLVSPLIENAYIHQRTKDLAATDPLTGVSNHRSFHEMLTREIARANRDKTEFCLIMLDIDDFKIVNDTYGHQDGDAVLQDLCTRIQATIREEDLLSRYGGEEFVIIVTSCHAKGAYALAERIRTCIAKHPVKVNGIPISYTVSIGLSLYDGNSPREKKALIKDADSLLYISKERGKNRVSFR